MMGPTKETNTCSITLVDECKMDKICVVISDLHVGDGTRGGDHFFEQQQDALEGLLAALGPGAPLGGAQQVELVLNGDSFDFLLLLPEPNRVRTDAVYGLSKVERVIAAHPRFFAALRRFLEAPGRQITFTIGNHDLELCYAGVREQVRRAIGAEVGKVRFCLSRAYEPFAGVTIEHGCQYDPWNTIRELWDGVWPVLELMDDGRENMAAEPGSMPLPWGTRYTYHAFWATRQRYLYFAEFIPLPTGLSTLALLCLIAPELVIEGLPRTAELLTHPVRVPSVEEIPGRGNEAAALFAVAAPTLIALQREVAAQTGTPLSARAEARIQAVQKALYDALDTPSPLDALKVIFPETSDRSTNLVEQDSRSKGMLLRDEGLRYALTGHTHLEGMLHLPGGKLLVDTGTWMNRLYLPGEGERTPEVMRWLAEPEASPSPLRDATRFPFVLLEARGDEPFAMHLCEWVGGRSGSYQPLPLAGG
jgi:UDP-2,3-diacylglucosamine pyrophosphatase LpxH